MNVIEVKGLTKRYGRKTAVTDLNLSIERGEIYGFLGRNGAGKTTTIRMMLGLIRPTKGTVSLFGKQLTTGRRLLTRVGAMVENPGFYGNISAWENLDIHRRMMGVADPKSIDYALDTVGLAQSRNKKVKGFSLGMKQRLGIARALLHEPELLILDEPTNGLDPTGIREVRMLLKSLSEEKGTTIFLSSHILSEVERIATTIGFVHEGRFLDELAAVDLAQRTRNYLELQVDDVERTAWALEDKLKIEDYLIQPDNWIRVYAKLDQSGEINRALVANGILVSHLAVSKESLEDYFIQLTGGERHAVSVQG